MSALIKSLQAVPINQKYKTQFESIINAYSGNI